MAERSGTTVELLGIRHHGPGSARSVRSALDELCPDVVLIELPADTAAALRWAGHPELEPPVALLGYLADEPSRAAFAPLATYSSEWQAARWAHEHDVPVWPVDLPLSTTLALAPEDEPLQRDPLAELATAAGDPDPERWWEDVIEHRGDGRPAFGAVAEAMVAVRADWEPPPREAMREAHMRREIRRARREGYSTAAVIAGAWHVPALDVTITTDSADQALLRGRPKAKVAVAWVPWSDERLASSTGYAAGVQSPGWYQHVYTHPGADGVGRFFIELAQRLRAADLAASPDEVIAGTRLADGLAALRGRPRPGLSEVLDAAGAVFVGGVDRLDEVRRRLVLGERVGRVPDDAPQAPLARDLERRRRATRLKMEAAARSVELDLRSPSGRRRSHLLHQLLALDVPWGRLEDGRGSSGTFRETWSIAWQPEFSIRLIERSAFGTTVTEAAGAALVARAAAARSLVEAVAVLDRALLADLPAAVGAALRAIDVRAARDPDVAELLDVLVPLATALRYGDVRDTDREAMRGVFDDLVRRVIVALPDACRGLDDDAARAIIERLTALQSALAMLAHPMRERALPDALEQLAEQGRSGLVHGRATRLLHDSGRWDAGRVERRLSRALSPGTPVSDGAAFVEGFLAGSGTVLIHDRDLREVVDRWIASLSGAAFDDIVPLLRRTFGGFEPAERRRLMSLAIADVEAPASVIDADPERVDAVLVTVRQMLGLPVEEVR
ncbi:MAG: DUF5682 family protein [Actinomycetota bacterium]